MAKIDDVHQVVVNIVNRSSPTLNARLTPRRIGVLLPRQHNRCCIRNAINNQLDPKRDVPIISPNDYCTEAGNDLILPQPHSSQDSRRPAVFAPPASNRGDMLLDRNSSATFELTECHLERASCSASNWYKTRLRILTLSGSISMPALTFFRALCHLSRRSSPLVCDWRVRAKRSFSYVRV